MAAGKIFVCYRRDDSAGHAGRLYDRLNQRFPGRVFMDVAGISIGTRWAQVIEETLRSCNVAVILIGKQWLAPGADGVRRIDQPNDPIRAELLTALRLNLRIIPLLVGGAAIPDQADLPSDLATIADWQALRVDDDDFDHDAARLIRALENELGDAGTDPHLHDAEARQTEVRRLVGDAEAAISRADWIAAAQTLRAVLALDPTHHDAGARLRFVTEQSKQAYQAPATPARSRSNVGLWVAVGGGVSIIALILVGWIVTVMNESLVRNELQTRPSIGGVSAPAESANTGSAPVRREPVASTRDTTDAADNAPVAAPVQQAAPAQPTLAGDYTLAGLSEGGVIIAATGQMRLAPAPSGAFHFQTVINVPGATFSYAGLLQRVGDVWTTTTLNTNDPRAVYTPIPTQIGFDGSRLATQNAYGQAAIWMKH